MTSCLADLVQLQFGTSFLPFHPIQKVQAAAERPEKLTNVIPLFLKGVFQGTVKITQDRNITWHDKIFTRVSVAIPLAIEVCVCGLNKTPFEKGEEPSSNLSSFLPRKDSLLIHCTLVFWWRGSSYNQLCKKRDLQSYAPFWSLKSL